MVFIFLRFFNLGSHLTFLGDQGRDAIIMKRILTLEHFPAIGAPTSIGMVYLGPFYYYFMAPWLLLFGFNPLGPAIGVACLSIILGLLATIVVNKHFGKLAGIFFLFLLTFSASNISLSRFSWNPNLLPIFTFFTLYTFYRLLVDKTNSSYFKNYFFALVFGALFSFSFQLHYLAALLLPTLLIFFVYQLIKTKQIKLLLTRLIAALISFSFFSLPLLIFDLRHNFLNSRNFLTLFSQGNAADSSGYWQKLLDTIIGFWQHAWQINLNSTSAIFLLILLFFAFIKFGQKSRSLFYWLMLCHLIFYLLSFGLMSSGRFEHYYTPIYYSFFLNLAVLLAIRFQNCSLCRLLIPILLLLYLLANSSKFKVYLTQGGNQIRQAQVVSRSVLSQVTRTPYQLVSIPFTEAHGQYRYFLEMFNKRPLEENSADLATELFVLCFQHECNVLNDPQWQIAVFANKKVAKIWTINNIKIYKIIHQK